MGKHAKLKEMQKWSNEKLHLENGRKLRGSISLTLRTINSKKPLRMRVRSWKHQSLLLCLLKFWRRFVCVVDPTKLKTTLACIVEADESTRLRMANSLPNHHEDYITKKTHYCSKEIGSQICSYASNFENSCSKVKSGQRMPKIGEKVHFTSLMDICHLKNAELQVKHQEGRIVLRSDIVTDDLGSCAVFTEQGSSASQMTAAKFMDIISRLPGFDGQTADAVSAYTQIKMEDAHKLLNIQKSECPDIWIRLPRQKWPKSWSSIEDPIVPLEKNLYGHP